MYCTYFPPLNPLSYEADGCDKPSLMGNSYFDLAKFRAQSNGLRSA